MTDGAKLNGAVCCILSHFTTLIKVYVPLILFLKSEYLHVLLVVRVNLLSYHVILCISHAGIARNQHYSPKIGPSFIAITKCASLLVCRQQKCKLSMCKVNVSIQYNKKETYFLFENTSTSSNEENFSKTLLTKLSKFFVLNKSTPFPYTKYELKY